MRITVDIKAETLNELRRITGQNTTGPAVAFAVSEFIKRERAKEFGKMLRVGAFDYPSTNEEIESAQG